jgi:hypothetical protein
MDIDFLLLNDDDNVDIVDATFLTIFTYHIHRNYVNFHGCIEIEIEPRFEHMSIYDGK